MTSVLRLSTPIYTYVLKTYTCMSYISIRSISMYVLKRRYISRWRISTIEISIYGSFDYTVCNTVTFSTTRTPLRKRLKTSFQCWAQSFRNRLLPSQHRLQKIQLCSDRRRWPNRFVISSTCVIKGERATYGHPGETLIYQPQSRVSVDILE